MKLKKIVVIGLVFTLLVAQFSWIKFNNKVYAVETQETVATKYFYNQLTTEAKSFYHAMEHMLTSGMLKKGNESYDLQDYVTQDQLRSYTEGSQDLLLTMGAAKDAFLADHPDLFYIDSDYLSLRVTSKNTESGLEYHATLGTGRSDSYRNKAFIGKSEQEINKAIEAVNKRVDEIVEAAKKIEPEENQNLREQQIKYVHEQIINNADYTYEDEVKNGASAYNVRNVYGAFVATEDGQKNILDSDPNTKANGQIVCEGYARAVKTVLDKLNIPCILVTGVYRHTEDQLEPHMWNYVQLEDEKWYGLDATFDDPSNGTERLEYFLVGDDKLGIKHVPTGIMSESNYEFTYPTLQTVSDKFENVYNTDGLVVELDDETYDERDDVTAAAFKISYKGMGYKKAAENGYYIVANFHQYYPGNDTWQESGWSYFRTDIPIYDSVVDIENDDGTSYTSFYMSHCKYLEVAVTDIAPEPYNKFERDPDKIKKQTTYMGSPTSFIVMSKPVYNPNGNYVAPPYIKKCTPIANSTVYIGSKYHVTVEYDDILIPTGEEIGMSVRVENSPNNDLNKYYKVENFKFDGQSTFTFDFTPSQMYEDDSVYYNIHFSGVVGSRSLKVPNDLKYFCANRCDVCTLKASQGIDWNTFGKPQLLENTDLSTNGWKTSDGRTLDDLSDALKHRMALVATRATTAEVKEMNDVIGKNEDTQNDTILSQETYNIRLTLCKSQIINTGEKVRVRLGFPPGYGPEDEGVTFKAYHFTKNEQGEIISVEEIPVIVTKLGLIVLCDSFSPFTIAAVEGEPEETTKKTIVLATTEGGTVNKDGKAANSIIEIDKGENITLDISPIENYELDEVVVGEETRELNNELTINYDELVDNATIVKIEFATKSTHQEEQSEGLKHVAQPVVSQPKFTTKLTATLPESGILNPGDEFSVTASLESFTEIGEGLLSVGGKLEYDTDVLEMVTETLEGKETWSLSEEYFNTENFKFITDTSKRVKTPGELFKVSFKVKEDAQTGLPTSIKLINITGGTGEETATAIDSQISVDIVAPVEKDELTSDEYEIGDYYITGIPGDTTVADFKNKIHASKTPIITKSTLDEEKILSDNEKISTGSKVTVGTLSYTLVVTGDVDGDGDAMAINDIAKIKLHYIEKETLLGFQKEAADLDSDSSIGVNDLALMKQNFIEKVNP